MPTGDEYQFDEADGPDPEMTEEEYWEWYADHQYDEVDFDGEVTDIDSFGETSE